MKAFVFKSSNALIGKFDVSSTDQVAGALVRFGESHTLSAYDYIECSGKTWTLMPGTHGLDLIEGREHPPKSPSPEMKGTITKCKCSSCKAVMIPRLEPSPAEITSGCFGWLAAMVVIGGILIAVACNNRGDIKIICLVMGFTLTSVGLKFIFTGIFHKPAPDTYCTSCNQKTKLIPLTDCKTCRGTGKIEAALGNNGGVILSDCSRCQGTGSHGYWE